MLSSDSRRDEMSTPCPSHNMVMDRTSASKPLWLYYAVIVNQGTIIRCCYTTAY